MKYFSLFLFYLIFYACGRIYSFAADYPNALFLHLLGLQFSLHSLLFYLLFCLKDGNKWVMRIMHVGHLFLLCTGWFTYIGYGFWEAMIISCVITHVFMLITISRINLKVGYKSLTKRAIWLSYFSYETVALFFYTKTQYLNYQKYDYVLLVEHWGKTMSKSAAQRLSDVSYHYQNLFIPVLIGVSILFIFGWMDWIIKKYTVDISENRIFIRVRKPKRFISFIRILFSKEFTFFYGDSKKTIEVEKENHILINTGIQFDVDNRFSKLNRASVVDKNNFYRYLSDREKTFLLHGENRQLVIILIRWLAFSVSRLEQLEPGEPPKNALIEIFKYPIKLLKKIKY